MWYIVVYVSVAIIYMEQININDIDNIFYMIGSLIRENINMMVRIHPNFNI